MLRQKEEERPLVKKGRLLKKDVIFLHGAYSEKTSKEEALGVFSARLSARLRLLKVDMGYGPTLKTVSTPISNLRNAVDVYCTHYERILVSITNLTISGFKDEVRKSRGKGCFRGSAKGPVLEIQVSDFGPEVLDDVWPDIEKEIKKIKI